MITGNCRSFGFAFASLLLGFTMTLTLRAESIEGAWQAHLKSPGGKLAFGIEFINTDEEWSCFLVNGPERIKIPNVTFDGKSGVIDIGHFDSKINFEMAQDKTLSGTWSKRKGVDKWSKMQFAANRKTAATKIPVNPAAYIGRWKAQFTSDSDHAIAIFKTSTDNQVLGTFMTTTGDYRYLDGNVDEKGEMTLSCFDGAHAFLFKARLDKSRIEGDFWSSDKWHDTWTAIKDDSAQLDDAFAETSTTEVDFGRISFPDLEGKPMRLDDPKFAGKARLIYVFGSWCPNCHDAAAYFAELKKKYGDDLSILGLAFEHTGEFKRDVEQVKRYLKRHGSSYPVLLAGVSDKAIASKSLPFLDRVRSFPTTVFVNQKSEIIAIHTGFTGPATGESYLRLKQKFESLIDGLIESSN